MFTLKMLCGWYNCGPRKMRAKLIEIGVIPPTDKGRGGRKGYELEELQPVFKRLGYPVEVARKYAHQLTLFH